MRRGCTTTIERALEVYGEQIVPDLIGYEAQVIEGQLIGYASIVYEIRNPSPFFGDCIDHL
jgi:hypothetical protein